MEISGTHINLLPQVVFVFCTPAPTVVITMKNPTLNEGGGGVYRSGCTGSMISGTDKLDDSNETTMLYPKYVIVRVIAVIS